MVIQIDLISKEKEKGHWDQTTENPGWRPRSVPPLSRIPHRAARDFLEQRKLHRRRHCEEERQARNVLHPDCLNSHGNERARSCPASWSLGSPCVGPCLRRGK